MYLYSYHHIFLSYFLLLLLITSIMSTGTIHKKLGNEASYKLRYCWIDIAEKEVCWYVLFNIYCMCMYICMYVHIMYIVKNMY